MRDLKSLTHADARQIVDLVLASTAGDGGKALTVCVSDVFGEPLILERHDGASGRTVKLAMAKSRQAAVTGQATAHVAYDELPSGEWQLKAVNAHRKDDNLRTENPSYLSLAGGCPVTVDGLTVGGVGVSGRAQLDDHAIGTAAATAWAASLRS